MKIRCFVKKPFKEPEEICLENELQAFQEQVNGYIETIPFCEVPKIICILNDEGKFNGMRFNFHYHGDWIMGPVVFCCVKGCDFASLPADVDADVINHLIAVNSL